MYSFTIYCYVLKLSNYEFWGGLLDRVEVRVREGRLDTFVEEVVRRCIGNVHIIVLPRTAGNHSDDAIVGITDNGPGVAGGRESEILMAIGVDGGLH